MGLNFNISRFGYLYYVSLAKPFPQVCWFFAKAAELSNTPWLRIDKWLIGSRLMGTLSVPMAALTTSIYGIRGLSEATISVINGRFKEAFKEIINNEILALKSLALTVGNVFYAVFGIVFGKKIYSAFEINKISHLLTNSFPQGRPFFDDECNKLDHGCIHDRSNQSNFEKTQGQMGDAGDLSTQNNSAKNQENNDIKKNDINSSEKSEKLGKEKESSTGPDVLASQNGKAKDSGESNVSKNALSLKNESKTSDDTFPKPPAIDNASKHAFISTAPKITDSNQSDNFLLDCKPVIKNILPIAFDVIQEQNPQNQRAIKVSEEIQPDQTLDDFFLNELRKTDTLNYDYIKKTRFNNLFKKPLVLAIKDIDYADYKPNSSTMVMQPILALTY